MVKKKKKVFKNLDKKFTLKLENLFSGRIPKPKSNSKSNFKIKLKSNSKIKSGSKSKINETRLNSKNVPQNSLNTTPQNSLDTMSQNSLNTTPQNLLDTMSQNSSESLFQIVPQNQKNISLLIGEKLSRNINNVLDLEIKNKNTINKISLSLYEKLNDLNIVLLQKNIDNINNNSSTPDNLSKFKYCTSMGGYLTTFVLSFFFGIFLAKSI